MKNEIYLIRKKVITVVFDKCFSSSDRKAYEKVTDQTSDAVRYYVGKQTFNIRDNTKSLVKDLILEDIR